MNNEAANENCQQAGSVHKDEVCLGSDLSTRLPVMGEVPGVCLSLPKANGPNPSP